ncbi:hypothetical protein K438DRAFT_1757867 [Mycena galopus ATCC 62051]|nr:hypothetical protein K438DRAFT_1757867 [Mycena galopus ATCC 62051]
MFSGMAKIKSPFYTKTPLHIQFCSDSLTHLLRHWNLDWEKSCSESLTVDHVSLRLSGNVRIQLNSTLDTLGHFFNIHDHIHGTHPKKLLQGPPSIKLPSSAIYLEGFISVKDFGDDTRTPALYFVHPEMENKKRKISRSVQGPFPAELSLQKRIRSQISTSLPLCSEFGAMPGFTEIPFVFASVSVAEDGVVTIDWPDLTLNAFTHYGYLLSQESTVLADIQSTTAIKADGGSIEVLFDMMTHTLDGSSGVGLAIMENLASRPSFQNTSVEIVANISISIVMDLCIHQMVQTMKKPSTVLINGKVCLGEALLNAPLPSNIIVTSANTSSGA